MLPYIKTTTGITLLIALSACGSMPHKEKVTSLQTQNKTAPTLDPLNARAQADFQFITGDVLSREGKPEKAIEHFEKVAALDPAPAVYMRLAEEYKKVDNVKQAIANAEKAVAKDSKNAAAHASLGEMYSADNSYAQAIAQYNIVLSLQPNNYDAVNHIGALYATKKDFKKAEKTFGSLLKNPKYETPERVHYYLGLMYLDQKAPHYEVVAENAFKKALKLKPGYEDALTSLANLYLQQKNSGKALALAQDFQKHQGYSSKIADMVAQIYIDNGDLDNAYKQLDYIASNSDRSLDAELKMALILIKLKRYDEATSKLNDLLVKFPDADTARYYLAAVYEESGDAKNAIRNYMLVPSSSDHVNDSIAHAAFLLKGQGKITQALALTDKALKAKADPQLYIIHASLLDAKADHAGAARSLEDGLTKFSKNTELRFQHAIMLDRLGKKDAMIAQMKKVLEIDPDHIQSMSYLAFSLAERSQNLTEAEKLARRASELSPQDGYVLDTLGWVLYKEKKFSESVQILEKAHQYQPLASIIAEHLADAYSMQSQTEKAKDMYNKAAGLTTDEIRANKIRSKIQNQAS